MTASRKSLSIRSLNKAVIVSCELYPEEPMHCERQGCEEELNGVMHHKIKYGGGFVFSMWLCQQCAKEFEETIE